MHLREIYRMRIDKIAFVGQRIAKPSRLIDRNRVYWQVDSKRIEGCWLAGCYQKQEESWAFARDQLPAAYQMLFRSNVRFGNWIVDWSRTDSTNIYLFPLHRTKYTRIFLSFFSSNRLIMIYLYPFSVIPAEMLIIRECWISIIRSIFGRLSHSILSYAFLSLCRWFSPFLWILFIPPIFLRWLSSLLRSRLIVAPPFVRTSNNSYWKSLIHE